MKTNIIFLPYALFFFLQLIFTSLTTVRAHCPPCPVCPPCPGSPPDSSSHSPPSAHTPPSSSPSASQEPPPSPKTPSKSTPDAPSSKTPPSAHTPPSSSPPTSKEPPPSPETPSKSTPDTPPSKTPPPSSSPPSQEPPPSPQSPSKSTPDTPPSAHTPPSTSPPTSHEPPPSKSTPETPPSKTPPSSPPISSESPPSSSPPMPSSSESPPDSSTSKSPPSSPTPSSDQSPPTPSSSQSPPGSSEPPSRESPPPSPSSSQSPPASPSSDQSPPSSSTPPSQPSPSANTPTSSSNVGFNSTGSSTVNTGVNVGGSGSASISINISFKGSFSRVFAFGGSYTDTGNAQAMGALSNFFFGANSPYGKTGFGRPSNRMSDGRLVLDFLCDALALPPPQPYKSATADFSGGVNFALAGATSLGSDIFAKYKIGLNLAWKMHLSMKMQIDWFNTYYQQKICKGQDLQTCKPDFENALFWIGEMGVNDYSRSFKTSISMQMLTDSCILHINQLLMTLLQNGARYIVVQGLPPVGCLSSGVSLCPLKNLDKMGCVTIINTAIMMHNQILQKKIEGFQRQYPDRAIIYGDSWNAYMAILASPQKYQIQEPFKACCGARDGLFNFNQHSFCGFPGTTTCPDPSKYVNWDGIHLTEAMHKHITQLLLHGGFCHPSFDTIVKKKLGT